MKLTLEASTEMLATVECPACHGVGTLAVERKLVAKKTGTYALAGTQPKMAAYPWPYLVCTAEGCDFDHPFSRK